jgi:hypothetical protein
MRITGMIKQIVLLMILGVFSQSIKSQGLEIGGGLGTSFATGDITRGFELNELGFAGQLFIRYNLSNVVSVRGTGLIAQVKGDDNTNPIDPFAELRGFDFQRINLEASAVIEYNFLDYKERNSLINWSPYFFIGGGLSSANTRQSSDNSARIQPVIPMGVGLKYRLNKQWNLEFEFGARKTFYDHLDKVSSVVNPNKLTPRYGNELDNDWYYFTGISISYTFYSVPCPFDYN